LISGSIFLCQRILFAALFWHRCVGVNLLQALISGVYKHFRFRMQPHARPLKQLEIVPSALLETGANYATANLAGDYLGLLCVALFLA
jgi:hypothetical protein